MGRHSWQWGQVGRVGTAKGTRGEEYQLVESEGLGVWRGHSLDSLLGIMKAGEDSLPPFLRPHRFHLGLPKAFWN